jgi:hypothetical protein
MKTYIQDVIRTYKKKCKTYKKLMDSLSETDRTLKGLHKLGERRSLGRRLVSIGIGLIFFPEPTPISESIGTLIAATGKLVDRMDRKKSLRSLFDDWYKNLRELNKLRREIDKAFAGL